MSNSTGPLPPNTTLYVKNIANKIKKEEVKRQLYCLFATYGKLLDVVATKTDGMRGQAFVVFQDLASSTAALRALDGFIFYDKPLSIDYAHSKSKATLVAELGPEALFNPELLSKTQKKKAKTTFSSAGAELKGRERKRAREEAGTKAPVGEDSDDSEDESAGEDAEAGREGKKVKIDDGEGGKSGNGDGDEEEMQMADSDDEDEAEAQDPAASLGAPLPAEGSVANNLLFCSDVPSEATDEMLGVLFQQYPGFKAVQLLPPKKGRTPAGAFAFVEFDSTRQATTAKQGLHEFKLAPGKLLSVAYAKRGPA